MADADINVCNKTITGDETWGFAYDTETKRQNSEWVGEKSPRPKKLKFKKAPHQGQVEGHMHFGTETMSKSRDINNNGGGVNHLWSGSDNTRKQRWRTTLPPAIT